MPKVSSVLADRLQGKKAPSKMKALAQASTSGDLSSFSGVFHISELSESEKESIENLLHRYSVDESAVERDLESLISITCEVKAITNQAAILHGERIHRAQQILKRYRDGAFTSWLVAAYGNRQTPYNFLQYYEFFRQMPKNLHPQIEKMPRQAVYSLASRDVSLEDKQSFVEDYQGETKVEMMRGLRERFPLAESDRRRENFVDSTISTLQKLVDRLAGKRFRMTKQQSQKLHRLMAELRVLVDSNE